MTQTFFQNQWEKAKSGFWLLRKNNLPLLFSFLAFFFPTQLTYHFWPDFSYVVGIKIDYLSPTVYFTDILSFCCLLALFLSLRKNLFSFFLQYRKWIGYFFFCFLLTFLLHPQKLLFLYGVVKLLEYVFLGVGFYVVGKTHLPFLLTAFLLGSFLQGVLAVFQGVSQASLNGWWYFLGERQFSATTPGIATSTIGGEVFLRPYATLPHPNVLGGFMAVSFLISLIFWRKTKHSALFFLGFFFLFITFLTISRTAIVGIFLAGGVYLFPKNKWILRGGIIALGILGLLFLSDTALTTRLLYYKQAGELFLTYPLGVGFRSYLYFLGQTDFGSYSLFHPVHNSFVLLLCELGVGIVGGILYLLWKIKEKIKQLSSEQLALLTLFFILAMNDHYLLSTQQGSFLLLFGLSLLSHKMR